jgi:hypothetical protein
MYRNAKNTTLFDGMQKTGLELCTKNTILFDRMQGTGLELRTAIPKKHYFLKTGCKDGIGTM